MLKLILTALFVFYFIVLYITCQWPMSTLSYDIFYFTSVLYGYMCVMVVISHQLLHWRNITSDIKK